MGKLETGAVDSSLLSVGSLLASYAFRVWNRSETGL